jgi:Ca2+-binding EF-hand superfamily protein
MLLKVIFFWTFLAREICRSSDSDASRRSNRSGLSNPKYRRRDIVLSEDQTQQIKEIFELFDTDGGGTIDRSELSAAMLALGFSSRHQKQKTNRSNIDIDALKGDDFEAINLHEFAALMKGELSGRDPLDEILMTFEAFHKPCDDQRELINLDKLRRTCKEYGVKLTEQELSYMIVQVASHGSNHITEEDYVRIMCFSPWF